jgi:hypothetical protein
MDSSQPDVFALLFASVSRLQPFWRSSDGQPIGVVLNPERQPHLFSLRLPPQAYVHTSAAGQI